jgi:hypothetical protein
MRDNKLNGLFVIWKKYQRRPEVLAPLIDAKIRFIPHLFRSKFLRLFDYLLKLIIGINDIFQQRPAFIIAQSPPIFSAIPALITGIPCIIDAHNPFFQVRMWRKLPLTRYLVQKSCAVIVHNSEILQLAKSIYPSIRFFNISDPIEYISYSSKQERQERQILVISSFDPWDEPVDLLIESIEELNDYTFIITADVNKLPSNLSKRLQQFNNVRLTGFLSTKDYHEILCTSIATLVLTTSNATQPSGACEALSSDTQLIVSKTSLTQKLFGEWAILVENNKESIVDAVKSLTRKNIDLSFYREFWNMSVKQEISSLRTYIEENVSKKT